MALAAALAVPLFIDWNVYRASFEQQASRMLGQAVHVKGLSEVRLLPVPALTFNDVEIGDRDRPSLTVKRFALHVELAGLVSGEVHVLDMTVDQPRLHLAVDENGLVAGFAKSSGLDGLDPAKTSLANVSIRDGEIEVSDARDGSLSRFTAVNTSLLEARSLTGPWKVDGTLRANGQPIGFKATTARLQPNGDLGLSVDITAPGSAFPGTIALEGNARLGQGDVSYTGKYGLTGSSAPQPAGRPGSGFRSDGAFRLDSRGLLLTDVSVANWLPTGRAGGAEQPNDLTGDIGITFGATPHFEAVVKARQIDFDRSFGDGPAQPAKVGEALATLVRAVAGLPLPPVPGSVSVDVPGVVVGGGMVQGVKFDVVAGAAAWQISHLEAGLPGKTTIAGSGLLSAGGGGSFVGDVRVTSDRPAAFAAWWRGSDDSGAARKLAAFDLDGHLTLQPDRVQLGAATAHMDGATLTGMVAWNGGAHPKAEVDLVADRLDLERVQAIIDLFGEGKAFVGALPDIAVKLKAGRAVAPNVIAEGLSLDAGIVGNTLSVRTASIGDFAGVRVDVLPGEVAAVTTAPRGKLTASLTANTLAGVSQLADALAPDWPMGSGLRRAAPALAPVAMTAQLAAPGSGTAYALTISGTVGGTAMSATLGFGTGTLAEFWRGQSTISVDGSNADANRLARQLGFDLLPIGGTGAGEAHIRLTGSAAEGYATQINAQLAGLSLSAKGRIESGAGDRPRFSGSYDVAGADIRGFLAMIGSSAETLSAAPLKAAGTFAGDGAGGDLQVASGSLGGRQFSGRAKFGRAEDVWSVDGSLTVDRVDLSSLTALGLGTADLFAGAAASPWATTPIGAPPLGSVRGSLAVTVGQLVLSEGRAIADAQMTVSAQSGGVDLRLEKGALASGAVKGDVLLRSAGGEASIAGQLELTGGRIDDLIPGDGREPLATGAIDLVANFTGSGRSAAALAASLSGNGSLTLRNGSIRHLSGAIFSPIVQMADAGTQFGATDLADQVAVALDAGGLRFDQVEAPFRISGGAVAFAFVWADREHAIRLNSGAVDLAHFTLKSDWTLASNASDLAVGTSFPQVDLTIEGPLGGVKTTVRPLRLLNYLQIRNADRQQKVADRLKAEIASRNALTATPPPAVAPPANTGVVAAPAGSTQAPPPPNAGPDPLPPLTDTPAAIPH